MGVGEVGFARFYRWVCGGGGGDCEFAFEAEAGLLADAVTALSVEGDGLDTAGAVAELDFEVFVAEEEWFGEWGFAASGSGGGLGWVCW